MPPKAAVLVCRPRRVVPPPLLPRRLESHLFPTSTWASQAEPEADVLATPRPWVRGSAKPVPRDLEFIGQLRASNV